MAIAIIAFQFEGHAQTLSSYLNTSGISTSVVKQDGQYVVALAHESDVERAKEITEAFLKQPNDPKYQAAAWQQAPALTQQQTLFRQPLSLAQFWLTPLTSLILVLCAVVYLASVMGYFQPLTSVLMIQPVSDLVNHHQWWRLFTPALLHFSVMHVVFNLLWWYVIGRQVEQKMSTGVLLIILLVSGVISNVAQLMVVGPNFGGLSGVVYGLMGFAWFIGWLRPQWGVSLPRPVVGFMLVWLVLGYADVLWVSMANIAHTVGLISGCLLAVALTQTQRAP